MKNIFLLLPMVFLIACGGGGGSSSNSGLTESIAKLYTGNKEPALINENNKVKFVRALFGNKEVPTQNITPRTKLSEKSLPSYFANNLNSTLVSRSLSSKMTRSAVSETIYCDNGAIVTTGNVDKDDFTGELLLKYNNCSLNGTTFNGSMTLVIHKFNQAFEQLEHFTLRYKGMNITQNSSSYTSSGESVVKIDYINGVTTSVDNILNISNGQEIFFEDFETIVSNYEDVTINGKIYLEDYGYIIVSTENALNFTSSTYFPDAGGPILMQGSNQTIRLMPKEGGKHIEVEHLDDNGQFTKTNIGDLSPFTIHLISHGYYDVDIHNISFKFQLSEPLDRTNIVLLNLLMRNSDNDVIASQITYDSDNYIINLTPLESLEYSEEYSFELTEQWYSVYGKELQAINEMTYLTSSDYYGPKVDSVSPKSSSSTIALNTFFKIEFNEEINANLVASDDLFLRRNSGDSYYSWVPTVASVSGKTLTITPVEPLDYNESYTLSLDDAYSSSFQDKHGNTSYFYNDDNYVFYTGDYNQKISLGSNIDYFDLDKETNKLYALSSTNKSLTVIDLTTDSVDETHSFNQVPSRFCIDKATDRIYLTTMSSSFIEEYRLSDFEKMASIPWSAKSYGEDSAHFEIHCTANKLYVSDAEWSPQLYSIDRTSPYKETELSGIESVGGFSVASTGNIYKWFQYGWSAGLAGSKIEHFQEETNGAWSLVDESTRSYPQHNRDPLSSPILLDEASNVVINKRYIFNSLNLEQVLYDFGEDKVIYDADFSRNRASTLDEIYSLDNYNKILDLPISESDGVVFDNEGDLYILKNKDMSLFIINESQM